MSISRSLLGGSIVLLLALTGCGAAEPAPEASSSAAEDSSGAPKADLKGVPDVVAVVNDEKVTLEEFTTAYESQLQQATASQQQTGQKVDQDQLKEQVADMLVNNHLLTQAASEAGIEATDKDVDALLSQVAEQNGFSSVDEVYAEFKKQGLDKKQVREDAAGQFQIDQYIDKKTDVAKPSEKELKAQYDTLVEQSKAQGGEGAESQIPPFEEVKEQLSQQAVTDKQNAATDKILEKLRSSGKVKVNL